MSGVNELDRNGNYEENLETLSSHIVDDVLKVSSSHDLLDSLETFATEETSGVDVSTLNETSRVDVCTTKLESMVFTLEELKYHDVVMWWYCAL